MSRRRRVLVAIAAATLVGVGTSVGGASSFQALTSSSEPLPQPSQGRCPRLPAQSLPGDALAWATLAAVEQAPAVYRGTDMKGMRATSATLARLSDPGRGSYARVKCGRRVQNRTVVVGLEFPAMRPSSSLGQGVVLVSRFDGEYRVWAQLH